MASLNEREQLFVALGAAIGSNCVPCVEKIVSKAKAAGIENLGAAVGTQCSRLRAAETRCESLVDSKGHRGWCGG